MLRKAIGLSIIGALAVACAPELLDEAPTEALGQALTCDTNNGLNPAKATLAQAMATELGTWDPLRHLTDASPTDAASPVTLSTDGVSLCASRGACPKTRFYLSLQNELFASHVPGILFNPTSYRSDLKASFDRQANLERNLAQNNPGALPEAHLLTSTGAPTNQGGCGVHYGYLATKPDGSPLAKPANLANRLAFFGYGTYGGNNPFIDFRTTQSTVYVDPTENDQTGGTTSDGSCIWLSVPRIHDPLWTRLDKCCMYSTSSGVGKTGLLKVLTVSPTFLYCKATQG